MKKKVFIIGNGFDIDLGWNTSFQGFLKSSFCPIHPDNPTCQMESFIARNIGIERWYDLESILREFASTKNDGFGPSTSYDEEFYYLLRDSLTSFIKSEQSKGINEDSLASNVLRAIIENGLFTSIYTFNYTDLYRIAELIGIRERFDYRYVHGSVGNNSIILGVDDYTNLRKGYSYLRKVFSPFFRPSHIRYDLMECDEVVFFGHSLGDMDYPYFADFFDVQSRCQAREYGKVITIFTKNNESSIQLLEQLRLMNGGSIEHLRNDNEFNIITSEDPDKVLLKSFFDRLRIDKQRYLNAFKVSS